MNSLNRYLRQFLLLALLLLDVTILSGQNPTPGEIGYIVNRHINEYFPAGSWEVESVDSIGYIKRESIFLIDLLPEGWILVSGDKRAEAVLGYSPTGDYKTDDDFIKNPTRGWISSYEKQIEFIRESKSAVISSSWYEGTGLKSITNTQASITIEPFIRAMWNQGTGWNELCPDDPDGPGGHALVGCVAVAMAQAISVFDYPATGAGQHSYTHPIYGYLSVNYSEAEYNWGEMSYNVPDTNNSKLLYHCAVSVNMNFGPDGSGASISNTHLALKSHYLFSNQMVYLTKNEYSDIYWQNLLNEQLQNGRPIIYRGESTDGASAHAFNIDGVKNSTYFHFNWGWGGKNNGYYLLSSLTPGTRNYTTDQRAVFYMQPYYYPTNVVLTNYIVPNYESAGFEVAEITIIDEATDNEYEISLVTDSTKIDGTWVMDYLVDGATLKTGVQIPENNNITDTIAISVTDIYGNHLEVEVILLLGKDTGRSDLDLNSFSGVVIYPNPAGDYIYISDTDNFETISVIVYSLDGKALIRRQTYPGALLDISGLDSGIYILEAESTSGRRLQRKVIKN